MIDLVKHRSVKSSPDSSIKKIDAWIVGMLECAFYSGIMLLIALMFGIAIAGVLK